MKKLYYRPQKISSASLLFLAVLSIAVVIAIRNMPSRWASLENLAGTAMRIPDVEDRMLLASEQAADAFDAIHCERVVRGHRMLDIHDPADTGMVGPSMSLVTSLPGHLEAKLTSVNPNFAAVAMRLLIEAGVRPGDRIAIGCTGSFPALNIAVYSAAEAMDLRPVIISSAASSQFGANSPDLMWPDMEKLLFEQGIINHRSEMVSRGGFQDRAAGMSDDTREILEASITRSGLPLMDSASDDDAIERRMMIYSQAVEDETYAAYINVGGGDASVGGTVGNDVLGEGVIRPMSSFHPRNLLGLNSVAAATRTTGVATDVDPTGEASAATATDCVAARFLASGVPVINMINAVKLAKQYGLPVASTEIIHPGEGGVYVIADMRRPLAVAGIVFILLATLLVVRPPARLVDAGKKRGWFGDDAKSQPQLMV
ncbi:poly-gamma-glutamate system protein [Rhodopirellula rubra]|uniref:Poly-gamma-glutamate system protein n=1 Tax=Aporhodopirellula rubra TaxID=980271 RepID=A0A7W5H4D9_9BACT|nr:poly-gamma-glutamate system protein [Aporhodopirellula rubra]MBB3204835.1 poly-gamma-glutamate system protein [Aporhodopirellula rubra]